MASQILLRPQDVVVVLKFLAHHDNDWTYTEFGKELGLSASQVFLSVNRAATAGLLDHPALIAKPNRTNIKEFLVHGVKYAFPVRRGAMTRGVPTAYAAPPLNHQIAHSSDLLPVWPYAEGSVRGVELAPLYKTVPKAALGDFKLYELLALVDAIRDGRARERDIAIRELTVRIDAV